MNDSSSHADGCGRVGFLEVEHNEQQSEKPHEPHDRATMRKELAQTSADQSSSGGERKERPDEDVDGFFAEEDEPFAENEASTTFICDEEDCCDYSDDDSSLPFPDPPPRRYERIRDRTLTILDHPVVRICSLVVMFLVVVDGAFWFFLTVGAHGMEKPEPTNWWLNFSIQALTALFTYMALISLPARLYNAVHLMSRVRSSEVGRDFYGRAHQHEIWYHIPRKRRIWIVTILLANCVCQYINQVFRIVYYSFELSNKLPGTILCNLFFVLSMFFGMVGAFMQIHEQHKLHKEHPKRFPPGPIAIYHQHKGKVLCCYKEEKEDVEASVERAAKRRASRTKARNSIAKSMKKVGSVVTKPRKKFWRWVKNVRSSMRLYGI